MRLEKFNNCSLAWHIPTGSTDNNKLLIHMKKSLALTENLSEVMNNGEKKIATLRFVSLR